MNFFEYLSAILSGPDDQDPRYGSMFLPVTLITLAYFLRGPSDATLFLALLVGAFSLAIDLYDIQTNTIVADAYREKLDQETCNEIDLLAEREHITIAKKILLTYPKHPNASYWRLKCNTEIYLSHHWFENEEAHKNLRPMLEMLIATISNNQLLKKSLIQYFGYTTALYGIFALKFMRFTTTSGDIFALYLIGFTAHKILQYGVAACERRWTYNNDVLAAEKTSPHAVKQMILFMDPTLDYDKSVAHLPNWMLTSPRTADRMARLDSMSTSTPRTD